MLDIVQMAPNFLTASCVIWECSLGQLVKREKDFRFFFQKLNVIILENVFVSSVALPVQALKFVNL